MNMEQECMEQRLSQIGAKIADATDLSRQAKELAERSVFTLGNAQKEIEELYVSLGSDGPAAVLEEEHR